MAKASTTWDDGQGFRLDIALRNHLNNALIWHEPADGRCLFCDEPAPCDFLTHLDGQFLAKQPRVVPVRTREHLTRPCRVCKARPGRYCTDPRWVLIPAGEPHDSAHLARLSLPEREAAGYGSWEGN